MTEAEIRRHLLVEGTALDAMVFLNSFFIPQVIQRLNSVGTRRRMALYGGERVPENERNLTDVRNRMSLLLEYKLAWTSNEILDEYKINDLFWTNVVANRFPDLEIRKSNGQRGARIEVKCLQSIAEEKSANFDTLKKDLNPNTDYVVVFVWDWFRDQAAVSWDRAPKILRGFVFHASSLAELRDFNWLNNPPNNLGDGLQGFDLRYAVNCKEGVYSEEEGNYGKLLRIWNSDLSYTPETTPILNSTIETYYEFEDFAVWSGFEVLANYILLQRDIGAAPAILSEDNLVMGFQHDGTGIVLKRRIKSLRDQLEAARSNNLNRLIVLNDKYQWVDMRITAAGAERQAEGRKPKHLVTHLAGN